MTRFVALLRGVNVGGAKRVPMADFRALLEALGYANVRTLLNSGNAVFDAAGSSAARHAKRIHGAIGADMGLDVPVVVKSSSEFAAIEAGNALAPLADDPSRLLVAFPGEKKALDELAALSSLVKPPERFLLGKQAAYFWCPQGILESRAGEALLGKAGRLATTRNWATVAKLSALLRAP